MLKASWVVAPVLITAALLLGAAAQNPAQEGPEKPALRESGPAGSDQKKDGKKRDPPYCPQYLMGQYNQTYYYYSQVCQECNTYAVIAVSDPYTCGGCCFPSVPSNCCGSTPPCNEEINFLGSGGGARGRRAADPSDPFEVVDQTDKPIGIIDDSHVLEDQNGHYQKGDVHFCVPAPRFKVTEFILQVFPPPPPTTITTNYYFRCFDIVNVDDVRHHLRVGHELTKAAFDKARRTPAQFNVAYGFDSKYNGSDHHQRASVTLDNESQPMNCYLFANSKLPVSP